MSRIRANKITNKIGTGAVELEKGAHLPIGMGITGAGGLNISGVVTAVAADIDDFLDVGSNIKLGNAGVITATSFVGSGAALTGIDATTLKDTAGNVKIQAQASGAVHTGIHTFTTLKSTSADFSGNVSIGGTLTYEDVINVDSVGLITARTGIRVSANADLRFANGTWSGEIPGKIQHNSNKLYIQSGSSGTQIRRHDGQSSWEWNSLGHFVPGLDSNVNIGENAKRVGNIYADTLYGDGSNLTGIEVGISTEALVKTNGQTASLNLTKDDHKVTATGNVTIDVTGGTEASSHTLRVVNSGIATVGFSTYFLFPSGGTPVLPTASGAISLISFTVHRAGAVGVSTQLLSGSSVNFSWGKLWQEQMYLM